MKRIFCKICKKETPRTQQRKVFFPEVKGIICRDCFWEIVQKKRGRL